MTSTKLLDHIWQETKNGCLWRHIKIISLWRHCIRVTPEQCVSVSHTRNLFQWLRIGQFKQQWMADLAYHQRLCKWHVQHSLSIENIGHFILLGPDTRDRVGAKTVVSETAARHQPKATKTSSVTVGVSWAVIMTAPRWKLRSRTTRADPKDVRGKGLPKFSLYGYLLFRVGCSSRKALPREGLSACFSSAWLRSGQRYHNLTLLKQTRSPFSFENGM